MNNYLFTKTIFQKYFLIKQFKKHVLFLKLF